MADAAVTFSDSDALFEGSPVTLVGPSGLVDPRCRVGLTATWWEKWEFWAALQLSRVTAPADRRALGGRYMVAAH